MCTDNILASKKKIFLYKKNPMGSCTCKCTQEDTAKEEYTGMRQSDASSTYYTSPLLPQSPPSSESSDYDVVHDIDMGVPMTRSKFGLLRRLRLRR